MITELYRFSDDEIIIKMKNTELIDLGAEIYDLLCDENVDNYSLCKQFLDFIRKGNDKHE